MTFEQALRKTKQQTKAMIGTGAYDTLSRRKNQLGQHLQKLFRSKPRTYALITGPPRSGTTAVGKWLGGHSKVTSVLESRISLAYHAFLREAARFEKTSSRQKQISKIARLGMLLYYGNECLLWRKTLIDKEPLEPVAFPNGDYASYLENIFSVWPDGRIIFMIRHPIDTVWSMQNRKWGYSLKQSPSQYYSVEKHIENWIRCAELILDTNDSRIYFCIFNQLIEHPVDISNDIYDFLSLERGKAFTPRPTDNVSFNKEKTQQISEKTLPLWKRILENV